MFAWLESASIDWARLIRGTDSIAKLVAPVCAIALIVSPAVSGARKPISTPSACSRSTSSALGGATLTTTSDSYTAPASSTIRAPACSYCSSGIRAPAPAPRSTTTSRPSTLELAHDFRDQRHAAFAFGRLPGNSDLHRRGRLQKLPARGVKPRSSAPGR